MEASHEQEAQLDEQMAPRPERKSETVAGGEDRLRGEQSHRRNRFLLIGGVFFWLLAVAGMVALSFVVHAHRQPFPFELSISREIQASITTPWMGAIFRFLTWTTDPFPDLVTVTGVLIGFAVFRWWRQGIFLALSVMVGNGIDALIGDWVQRLRPAPNLIHVDSKLMFNSFPSGHSCHMMVFYGFLLFLTLTQSVRTWRYHWLVFPLQFWALLNICMVGFARLWEGEHWLLDVLGGYLDGAIWMSLFIFIYLIVTNKIRKRRRRNILAAQQI
ncbi:MAG TPA: phosphatase PAP2 family protein [Ktedonobacteraceae bacterium]|nr:phosphatase PAP2 family protein [Ktedonobacteraceae bacterium]